MPAVDVRRKLERVVKGKCLAQKRKAALAGRFARIAQDAVSAVEEQLGVSEYARSLRSRSDPKNDEPEEEVSL